MMLEAIRHFSIRHLSIRHLSDRILGRGSAAITVPVMDGALKANRLLDEATVVAELPEIDDLASDGDTLWASAGRTLYRLQGSTLTPVRSFDANISAVAARSGGLLAVAVGGKSIRVMLANNGLPDVVTIDTVGVPLVCVNALAFEGEEQLIFSEGSQRHGPADWCRDLMELGTSGRACRWNFRAGTSSEIARGMQHAYGVLAHDGAPLVSESWLHRVVGFGDAARLPLPSELPGYPSRMTPAADGGFWLACFVCRTQLVEFVLREPAYRQRMLAEVDPRYWIAPAIASGKSFLEPLQGAGVKTMGVMKPWAPRRSYGLVLRVGRDGQVMRSLHSQVDGKHHGITGLTEHKGRLFVASKGSGRLLAVGLAKEVKV
jgi:hypothetical protein